jgi:hypothetical protein
MEDMLYRKEDYGKEVVNNRGKKVKIRKYFMDDSEFKKYRDRWQEDLVGVDESIISKAGSNFFNPYRKGIYYYQIQSLFLLGCNEWHSLSDVVLKLSSLMSREKVVMKELTMTAWDLFKNRSYHLDPVHRKDYLGKIQENMVFFQRLSQLHPYGYKLRQVFSAVDIKRVTKKGFNNGLYFYRLSTYNNIEDSIPIKDFSEFKFPRHENKYVNYKFLGKIITRDKEINKGQLK